MVHWWRPARTSAPSTAWSIVQHQLQSFCSGCYQSFLSTVGMILWPILTWFRLQFLLAHQGGIVHSAQNDSERQLGKYLEKAWLYPLRLFAVPLLRLMDHVLTYDIVGRTVKVRKTDL